MLHRFNSGGNLSVRSLKRSSARLVIGRLLVQSQPGANLGCSYNGSYSCLPSRQRRSNSGTPLHNRITSFWFHTVKSRHTGAAVDWPCRVANGSTPRSYPVVSGFFGVLASIQFKQFVELSAAENVLFVFPNELRKAYALFVIKRKPLVVNGVVTIFL